MTSNMSNLNLSQRTTKIYPVSQPRRIVVNRSSPSSSGISVSSSKGGSNSDEYNLAADPELAKLHSGVGERIESRGRQKEQMNELNERLADYIEKVRFLDAQNRRLKRELDVLRDRHGRETEHVRARYECEMNNLKDLVEECEREKIQAEKDLAKALEDLNVLRHGADDLEKENKRNQEVKDRLNTQLAQMEGEIAELRRRAGTFDDIKSRNKAEIVRLRAEENRLKKDLENEIQGRFKADLEATYLKDVVEATEGTHLVRWQDIANRVYRDSTAENREAWSSEFKKKFKQMQDSYEEKVNDVTEEINESLTLKLRQNVGAANRDQFEMSMVKTETTTLSSKMGELEGRLKALNSQISDQNGEIKVLEADIISTKQSNESEIQELSKSLAEMKSNCSHAKDQLQKFFDMKLSTEVELAAYKKLLESEAVSETIDFFDSGRYQQAREHTEPPKYFSSSRGGYVGRSEV